MADRIGQQLDNYRLTRLLGAGGFGEVYLAEHLYRTTQVAIKILPQLAQDDLHSFLIEARTFRLKHTNIVQVLDFGVEGRIPFIVMEYAPNGTLRQRHPKGTRVLLPTIVSYVKQVASALQYAHDERLVHRDVKPENMLIGVQNQVLLSDFGIATIAHGTASQSVEAMAGTIPYMAPEQIQGRPRSASDQYSLGVVVYQWLCGDYPFHGTLTEVAMQHATMPPPSLREKVPTILPNVEQVVLTALAKDPKQRFGSVLAFATALEQASQAETSQTLPASQSLYPADAMPPLHPAQTPTEPATSLSESVIPTELITPPSQPSIPTSLSTLSSQTAVPTELVTPPSQASLPPTELDSPVSQSTEVPTPVPVLPFSQQAVSEVPADTSAQPQTILPLSGKERLRQADEERHQAEEERACQEKEQADKLEEERVRKAEETVLAATEQANLAHQNPLPTEVARSSKPPALRPDAMVTAKPAKPGASRRFVPLGLAGLVIVALASGIAWLTVHPASPAGSIQASPTGGIHASPAGSITEFLVPTASSLLRGITAGPDGNLWFIEYYKIGRISPSGTITEFPVPTADSGPWGITAGPNGNLWFTEASGNKIGRISPGGRVTEFPVPTDFSRPLGITAGPDGNLWFTEQDSNKIGRFTPGK